MIKGSSGGGLSSNQNDAKKQDSDDLKNKKQSNSRTAQGKIKSHSNYYDAKSMNEKISQSKSYHEGSQYSSKNSVKSGGNEGVGNNSANNARNNNFDRHSQKAVSTTTNNSNKARQSSFSQGGGQNRNINRSMQSIPLHVNAGHSNAGSHTSNQSYDEFIS